MALLVEEHFCRPSTRGKMALPAGQLSRQRAVSIYSALQTTYSAPIFRASLKDALPPIWLFCFETKN
jgi:hypothetical protein